MSRAPLPSAAPRTAAELAGSDPFLPPFNRRRSWREPVLASAILTAEGTRGAAAQRPVRVINLSEGGVGLHLPTPVGIGMEFRLDILGHPPRSARICIVFCKEIPGGFEAGARFIASPPSPE